MAREDEINEVCTFYREFHPRSRPGKKERDKILERLRDGYSVQDLKDAIEGCHGSDWHNGNNDRRTKYQSLELIVRDSARTQNFIELFMAQAMTANREYEQEKEREEQRIEFQRYRAMRQKERET